MAVIPVVRKSESPWWLWLIGLLLLLVIVWFVWQMFDRDRDSANTSAPAAVTTPAATTPAATTPAATTPDASGPVAAPAGTTGSDTATPAATTAAGSMPADTPTRTTDAVRPGATAPGDRVTDAGIYASTSDKLSLVGRQAELSNVRVVRVVGPKSFTLASGSEEFLVVIDQDLNRGVGTQGQIAPGNTLNLKGNFQRLQQDEINNISSNRFRDLTEPEREWLKKTQVYLHATEFGKGS
jgi:hypothetical protein